MHLGTFIGDFRENEKCLRNFSYKTFTNSHPNIFVFVEVIKEVQIDTNAGIRRCRTPRSLTNYQYKIRLQYMEFSIAFEWKYYFHIILKLNFHGPILFPNIFSPGYESEYVLLLWKRLPRRFFGNFSKITLRVKGHIDIV